MSPLYFCFGFVFFFPALCLLEFNLPVPKYTMATPIAHAATSRALFTGLKGGRVTK
jgi:hypothetical protein